MSRGFFILLLLAGLGGSYHGRALAQTDASEGCLSFSAVSPDPFGSGGYTIPIALGRFADLEMVSTADFAGLLDISVYDAAGVLRTRRTGVLIPRRVVLASDTLDVDNLFEISSAVTVKIVADVPLNVDEVRRD